MDQDRNPRQNPRRSTVEQPRAEEEEDNQEDNPNDFGDEEHPRQARVYRGTLDVVGNWDEFVQHGYVDRPAHQDDYGEWQPYDQDGYEERSCVPYLPKLTYRDYLLSWDSRERATRTWLYFHTPHLNIAHAPPEVQRVCELIYECYSYEEDDYDFKQCWASNPLCLILRNPDRGFRLGYNGRDRLWHDIDKLHETRDPGVLERFKNKFSQIQERNGQRRRRPQQEQRQQESSQEIVEVESHQVKQARRRAEHRERKANRRLQQANENFIACLGNDRNGYARQDNCTMRGGYWSQELQQMHQEAQMHQQLRNQQMQQQQQQNPQFWQPHPNQMHFRQEDPYQQEQQQHPQQLHWHQQLPQHHQPQFYPQQPPPHHQQQYQYQFPLQQQEQPQPRQEQPQQQMHRQQQSGFPTQQRPPHDQQQQFQQAEAGSPRRFQGQYQLPVQQQVHQQQHQEHPQQQMHQQPEFPTQQLPPHHQQPCPQQQFQQAEAGFPRRFQGQYQPPHQPQMNLQIRHGPSRQPFSPEMVYRPTQPQQTRALQQQPPYPTDRVQRSDEQSHPVSQPLAPKQEVKQFHYPDRLHPPSGSPSRRSQQTPRQNQFTSSEQQAEPQAPQKPSSRHDQHCKRDKIYEESFFDNNPELRVTQPSQQMDFAGGLMHLNPPPAPVYQLVQAHAQLPLQPSRQTQADYHQQFTQLHRGVLHHVQRYPTQPHVTIPVGFDNDAQAGASNYVPTRPFTLPFQPQVSVMDYRTILPENNTDNCFVITNEPFVGYLERDTSSGQKAYKPAATLHYTKILKNQMDDGMLSMAHFLKPKELKRTKMTCLELNNGELVYENGLRWTRQQPGSYSVSSPIYPHNAWPRPPNHEQYYTGNIMNEVAQNELKRPQERKAREKDVMRRKTNPCRVFI